MEVANSDYPAIADNHWVPRLYLLFPLAYFVFVVVVLALVEQWVIYDAVVIAAWTTTSMNAMVKAIRRYLLVVWDKFVVLKNNFDRRVVVDMETMVLIFCVYAIDDVLSLWLEHHHHRYHPVVYLSGSVVPIVITYVRCV